MKEKLFKYIFLLSALILPVINIGLALYSPGYIDYSALINEGWIVIISGVSEELFFRGFLLEVFLTKYKFRTRNACLVVSVLFGMAHIVNVFSYATRQYAIIQCLCAFGVSFYLSAIYCKTNKIILCIIIHSLINLTSIWCDEVNISGMLTLNNFETSLFLGVGTIYFLLGLYLIQSNLLEDCE